MAPYVPPAVPVARELDVPTVPSDPTDDTTLPPAHVPAVAACAAAADDASASRHTPTAHVYVGGTCGVADEAGGSTYDGPHGSTSGADPTVTVELEALQL